MKFLPTYLKSICTIRALKLSEVAFIEAWPSNRGGLYEWYLQQFSSDRDKS